MTALVLAVLTCLGSAAAAEMSDEERAGMRAEEVVDELARRSAGFYAESAGEPAGREFAAKERGRVELDERFRLGTAEIGTLISRYRDAPAEADLLSLLEEARVELGFWTRLRRFDDELARFQSLAAPEPKAVAAACAAAEAFVRSALAEGATPIGAARVEPVRVLSTRVMRRSEDLRGRHSPEAAAAGTVALPAPAPRAAPSRPTGKASEAAYRRLFDGSRGGGEGPRTPGMPPASRATVEGFASLEPLPNGRDIPPATGLAPQIVDEARLAAQEEFLKEGGSLGAIERIAADALGRLRGEERRARAARAWTPASGGYFHTAESELRLIMEAARAAERSRSARERTALLESMYSRLDHLYAVGDRDLRPSDAEYRAALARLVSAGEREGDERPRASDEAARLDAALAAFRADPNDRASRRRLLEIFRAAGQEFERWEAEEPQALYDFLYKAHAARAALARGTAGDAFGPVLRSFDESLARFVSDRASRPGRPGVSGAPERAAVLAFAETLSFFPATAGAGRRAAAGARLDREGDEAAAAAEPFLARLPAEVRVELERERGEARAEPDAARRAERLGVFVERALEAARADPELAPALDADRLAQEAVSGYREEVKEAAERLSSSAAARDGLAAMHARAAGENRPVRAEELEALRENLSAKDREALDAMSAGARRLQDSLAEIELRQAEAHAAHPELRRLQRAAAAADFTALEFIRSGDAPDGTAVAFDGPEGRVEARAGPWVFARDARGYPSAPLSLEPYLRELGGRVPGWHSLGARGRSFRSHDGRLQILGETGAGGAVSWFFFDGAYAGSVRPPPEGAPANGDPRLESADPDHPRVTLLGRGDSTREPEAWIDLSHLAALANPDDRRAAIGELSRELGDYLGSIDAAALESFLLHELGSRQGVPSLIVQRRRQRPEADIRLQFENDGSRVLIEARFRADAPRRIEGAVTLAPAGSGARRVARIAYEPGIFESTMDENATRTNPFTLEVGARAVTERFALDAGRRGARIGEPVRGAFRPHTDVTHLWAQVAGAGLSAVGSVMQEAGAQIRWVAIDPLAAELSGDARYRAQVLNDSQSNHNRTPLAMWLQRNLGQNWAAEQWASMPASERRIYADRAREQGRTDALAGYREYRDAANPYERNMRLARRAQSDADRTGSRWDKARAWGFTGVAVGYQVGEGLLGSLALGGATRGIAHMLPRMGRALGLGMEAADKADTLQSLAQLPVHLLQASLSNPDSLAALGMTLADLEGVGDLAGGAGRAASPGAVAPGEARAVDARPAGAGRRQSRSPRAPPPSGGGPSLDPETRAAIAEGKASMIQNLLSEMIRSDPRAAAELGHLHGMTPEQLALVKVDFEPAPEGGAQNGLGNNFAEFQPDQGKIVFHHSLVLAPTMRLVETLAHERQHHYDDLLTASAALPNSVEAETRGHEAESLARQAVDRRRESFRARAEELGLSVDEIAGDRANRPPFVAAYMDSGRELAEIYRGGGRDALDAYVYGVYENVRSMRDAARRVQADLVVLDRIADALEAGRRPAPDDAALARAMRPRLAGPDAASVRRAMGTRTAMLDMFLLEARAELRAPAADPISAPASPRSRLVLGDRTVSHRDNVIDGTYDGRPVVVKLNAAPNEHAAQIAVRAALERFGISNVHVPATIAGGPTSNFLDKALAAAPEDGGIFAKITGEVLGYFRPQQTVITERLPPGAVSLREVLEGKAELGPIDPADFDALYPALAIAAAAGHPHGDLGNPSNIHARQEGGRTHFYLIDWSGRTDGPSDPVALDTHAADLAKRGLFGPRAPVAAPAPPAPAPVDPRDRAREIRDAPDRRPPVADLMTRFLRAEERAGIAMDNPTPVQGRSNDCFPRSIYNNPEAGPIRDVMTYETFLDLSESILLPKLLVRKASSIKKEGVVFGEPAALARALGFTMNRIHAESPEVLVRHLGQPPLREGDPSGPRAVQADLHWRSRGGANQDHAVVVEGAFKEAGEWKFVVRDPHEAHPYLFTWADLSALGANFHDVLPAYERGVPNPRRASPEQLRASLLKLLEEHKLYDPTNGAATGELTVPNVTPP